MKVKAVFFDMDDTLVLTSKHDVTAYNAVAALVQSSEGCAGADAKLVVESFKKLFAVDPWDKSGKVEVNEWRGGLWAKALMEQGVSETVGKEVCLLNGRGTNALCGYLIVACRPSGGPQVPCYVR